MPLVKIKKRIQNTLLNIKLITNIRSFYAEFLQITLFINKLKEKTKYKNFVTTNKKVLGQYKSIWNKISKITGIEFDKKPVSGGQYINIKLTC